MHLFAAIMFLLVGLVMITLVTCVLVVLTRWKWISAGPCALAVFLFTAGCFVSRYSLNWHTLLRPLVVSILFYAAMQIGITIAQRIPQEGDNPPQQI